MEAKHYSILSIIVLVLTITIVIGLRVLEANQAKRQIPVQTTPIVQTPNNEVTVFSFYDTQLQVMCYVSSSGMDCLVTRNLSKAARDFIDDRVAKHKQELGLDNIIIPRIVPLDK